MWQMFLLILVALFAVKFLTAYFYWTSKGIPHENFLRYWYRIFVIFNRQPVWDVIREDVKKYGRVYGSFKGFTPSLVIADLEIAKEVMIKQFGNFFKRSFEFDTGDPLWDKRITNLPYDHWKTVRAVMGHSFTPAKLKSMIPKLSNFAKRLKDKMEAISASPENEVVLRPYLQAYGMDSIAAISFGIDLNCITDMNNEFVTHATGLFKPGLATFLLVLAPNWIKYLPFVHFPPKSTSEFFGNLGKHVLAEKRKKLDEVIKTNTADIIDNHLIAQRDDPRSGLTDEVLASQAFIFFIGGLDTTVFTLEYCTYYLAINPEIQEKVYENIKSVMGDREDFIYDDLHKLQLLEACSLETLRLMPMFFAVDRVCSKDTIVAGMTIKKGMPIDIPITFIHYDPTYFPEPEKFKPERFLKGSDLITDSAAYLSFGEGPKNCVGKRLALMNVTLLLATLLLKMKFVRTDRTPVPLVLNNGIRFSDFTRDPLYIKLVAR